MFLIRRIDYTKLKAQMANFITLINLALGIMAIIFMFEGSYKMSIFFIILAVVSDRFDGLVARKYNIESEFGKEFDSLCDLVSFGVAPALLVYHTSLSQLTGVGVTLVVLYIICGAIRLARYNVQEFDGSFYGIPITVCGFILTFFVIFHQHLSVLFFAIMISILTVSMISNIRIPKM
ncbi:CDP-diacylglycerol--serine O-phosphatidyltransferase [Ornithinibacillus sp. 4-3]|uniref:CDP-diacylglycerol--serine O-phosphatidyltransferase n=1 Tax=Ornithinibacillus sp. 4-3 TaxID=3231488 RepID=A0AB39HQ33_9BACI